MSPQTRHLLWEALSRLSSQHPVGITTWGMCSKGCGRSAKGSATCATCLGEYMIELGVSKADVEAVMNAHKLLQLARIELDEIQEKIMK